MVSLFLLYFLFLSPSLIFSTRFSFLSSGKWEVGDEVPCNHYMCTPKPNTLTWKSDHPQWKYYFHEEACSALIQKGLKKIYFYGDSYMRQIYSAMLITLNGDYQYGSIGDPKTYSNCQYHRQFNERGCGQREYNQNGTVCNGKIILEPALCGLENLDACKDDGIAILFSFGNHHFGPNRYGVNNATAFQHLFQSSLCPAIGNAALTVTGDVNKCSVWWVSTHARYIAYFLDESPASVDSFNEEMKEFFESRKCGNTNYIDVYNMTNSLIHHVLKDRQDEALASQLSYDKVHWGMEVNLLKAQIILNALLLAPVKKSKWKSLIENQD